MTRLPAHLLGVRKPFILLFCCYPERNRADSSKTTEAKLIARFPFRVPVHEILPLRERVKTSEPCPLSRYKF